MKIMDFPNYSVQLKDQLFQQAIIMQTWKSTTRSLRTSQTVNTTRVLETEVKIKIDEEAYHINLLNLITAQVTILRKRGGILSPGLVFPN